MLGWVLFHRSTEALTFAQDQNSIVTLSGFGAASVVLEQPDAVAPPASTTQTSDTEETTLGKCAWRGPWYSFSDACTATSHHRLSEPAQPKGAPDGTSNPGVHGQRRRCWVG